FSNYFYALQSIVWGVFFILKKLIRSSLSLPFIILKMKKFLLFAIISIATNSFGQTTVYETSDGSKTATYPEVINFYLALEKKFSSITVFEMGQTDSGNPLHVVVFDPKNKTHSKTS